jgi:hypothetical protein
MIDQYCVVETTIHEAPAAESLRSASDADPPDRVVGRAFEVGERSVVPNHPRYAHEGEAQADEARGA